MKMCAACAYAKNGWFIDFKKQISLLHRVKRIEESASADHVAGAKWLYLGNGVRFYHNKY
jgi:hypothetical protein